MAKKRSHTWAEHIREHRSGYEEIAGWELFEGWDRNFMADGVVEDQLRHGLIALYGSEEALARRFLQRAVDVHRRALQDEKFRPEGPGSGFPRNLAQSMRARFYAGALLGETCDYTQIEEAARHYETWCRGYRKREWNGQAEAYYLNAVRLHLIAGNLDPAAELLGARRIHWHREEAESLWRLTRPESPGPEDAERFDRVFLPMCSPRHVHTVFFEIDIVRFELSILRHLYLSNSSGTIDWRRVIARIVKGGSSRPSN